MTGLFFRRLALGVVVAAGFASIMATSPPEPAIYFEETNIQQALRCPGTDVTVDWRLNEPAPVSITVDGREYRADAETKRLTLPADLFDRTDSPMEALLRIDVGDADYPNRYEIRTLRQESWVDA